MCFLQHLLDEGTYRSITEIAALEGIDVGQASRLARLTQMAPSLVDVCMAGKGCELTLGRLICRTIPLDWDEQRPRISATRQ